MKHERIDDKARVWTITMGPDGKLTAEVDERVLAEPCEQIAEAVIGAAGRTEIAENRLW
jgi:hypothetical protein